MSKENSLLFHSFCFLMAQLKELRMRSERLHEIHQQVKSASWDKDGVAWSRFLRAKGHLLWRGGPHALLSEALAEAETSPVTQVAEAYLRAGLHKQYFLRSARRPTIPVPTAVRRTFAGHGGAVTKLAMIPRGLLSSCTDGNLRLWSLETGDVLQTFSADDRLHTFEVFADKKRALTLGQKEILLWDLEEGKILEFFDASDNHMEVLALHPDEESFFDSNYQGQIYQRSLSDGRMIRTFRGHKHRPVSLLFLPNGNLLSAAMDGELRFWQMETGECLQVLDGQQRVLSLVANAERTRALSGDKFGTVVYWDLAQPRLIQKLADLGLSSGALSFAFSPDGARAVSGCYDGVLRLWDLRSGREPQAFHSISGDQHSVLWHQENQIFVANQNGSIHQMDLTLPSPPDPERHFEHVVSIALQEQGNFALSGAFDGTILLWDVSTGRLLQRLSDKRELPLNALAIHPTLALGASTTWSGNIHLWDLQTKERVRQIKTPKRSNFLSFACDDARIISLEDDDTMRAFSREGELLWEVASIEKNSAVRLLPQDRILCLRNGAAVILNAHDGSRAAELTLGTTNDISIHPDQQSVLTISKELTRWQLSDGTPLVSLPIEVQHRSFERPQMVGTGVVLPDGETLAHCEKSGEIVLWSLRTGERLRQWKAHEGELDGLAILPEGRLVSVGRDRRVVVWELSTQEKLAVWHLEASCCALRVTNTGRIICGDSTGGVFMFDLVQG